MVHAQNIILIYSSHVLLSPHSTFPVLLIPDEAKSSHPSLQLPMYKMAWRHQQSAIGLSQGRLL